jgi:hypothetical protein
VKGALARTSAAQRRFAIVCLGYLALMCLTTGTGTAPTHQRSSVPMVGFSFSPEVARSLGQEPTAALASLLQALEPDLLRLPVYWNEVEPSEGQFDFSLVDDLLGVVAAANAHAAHGRTRVLLVVGMRNIATPELHLPRWAGAADSVDLARTMHSDAYGEYLTTTFLRYSEEPLLFAWQVENEPLDSTNDDLADIALPYDALISEIEMVRQLDPSHPIVVTSFNSAAVDLDRRADSPLGWLWNLLSTSRPAGHPRQALMLGDVLGLDVYVVTPNTPLDQAPASRRIGWKSETLDYWAQLASAHDKALWITEMQAAPWQDAPGFTPVDLLASAHAYAGRGEQVALLWGVEQWLTSSEWMQSGRQAFAALRGHEGSRPAAARRRY